MLRLTLFGGFQARLVPGDVLSLSSRKAQALLAYLGAHPGQAHPRDKLAALLWGESRGEQARDGLRHALAALRQALPATAPPILLAEGHTLALSPAGLEVDVATFERCVAGSTPAALERAAGLYAGDLLSGFSVSEPMFEEWLIQERERLRELALEALARLLAHQAKSGATEPAIQSAVRLLALDPLPEVVHRALMRLYARVGRRGSALHQYQLCVGILQRELGIEPEQETKELYQEILRRRPATATTPEPLRAGNLLPFAPVPRPPLSGATDTPLIGRDAELAGLRAVVAGVIRGRGRIAAIVGDAGVGKTRLVAEFVADSDLKSGVVLVGRCHESEQILPFGPWVDALRIGEVTEDRGWLDTLPRAIRRELGRLLPELTPDEGEAATPPDYMKLFEGVALLLGHMVARQPTVLILEDVHWADEMSARLLAFIGRRLPGWRLLLVVTARAEELVYAPLLQRVLEELEREPHVTTMALGPLSRRDTVGLVQALARPAAEEAAVARLGEQMWRTSGGNPFVVVQAMRAVAQEALSPGLAGLPVPERVRDIIDRQLDRLDERSRELVARAAVIGREFEFSLLQHVSGLGEEEAARGVEELTRRRVLHSVGEHLDFTHDRVREVAYSRILASRRKVLHRRVAEALATLHASDLEPHHLALGLHYAQGEVWDRAVVHLRRAGVRAIERAANREAATCLERALTALAHLPERRETLEEAFDIRLELRTALSRLAEIRRSRERLREAATLAERLNDDRRRALACAFLTNAHSWLGELDAALAFGTSALGIAGKLGDVELQFLATTYLAQAHYHRGEYEQAVQLASHNLEALPAHRAHHYFVGVDAPASVYDRAWLVLGLAHLGRFAEAVEQEREMSRLAELTQYAFPLCSAFYGASALHLLKGDWAKARSATERWIEAARKGDLARHRAYSVAWSAWALAQLDEVRQAESQLSEGEQLLESQAATGHAGTLGWDYYALGRGSLRLGRLDKARRLAELALECSPPRAGFAPYALHLLGDIATHPDRFDSELGEEYYRQALALAEPRGMRPLVAHCHLGLGKLYRRTGKRQQAQEHLTAATTLYREMDMQFWLEQAETEVRA